VQSLDILKFFDRPQNLESYGIDRRAIIEWIYSLQTSSSSSPSVIPSSNTGTDTDTTISDVNDSQASVNWRQGGFKGGTYLGPIPTSASSLRGWCKYDGGHIAMTYVALCTLATLGDDLSRVDRGSIIRVMKEIQLDDGSFKSTTSGSEHDMRFVYCACAISHMLDDWTGINVPKTLHYIRRCRTWDGGIGLTPGQEAHGGSVYCATASLSLMGRLGDVLDEDLGAGGGDTWRSELVRWCVSRQVRGMQGRTNKCEDTCYSYWVGGSLRLLGCDHLLDTDELRAFVMECQTDLGGFSKLKGHYYPDLLHSFYSLAWLSLSQSLLPSSLDGTDKRVPVVGDGKNAGAGAGCSTDTAVSGEFTLNDLDCTLGIVSKRISIFQTQGTKSHV